jgi:hypothetical protein
MSTAAIVAIRRGARSAVTLDAALQPFADGDYDNGYVNFYDLPSGSFDGTEVLVGSVRISTPAIASIVAADDIILDVPDVVLDDRSVFANDKGYTVEKSDHTGVIYGSAGLAGTVAGSNDPDLVVADPDTDGWFSGDVVPLAGAFHVRTALVPTSYDVTASNLTPNEDDEYTAFAQAKNAGAALHRIGITLTPSLVDVSGPGGGSITEAALYTNKNGVSSTAHVTAAPFDAVQTVHVTDGTATGDSANVVTQEGPMWELIAETKKIGNAATGPAETTTDDINTTNADLIVLGWENFYGADPVSFYDDTYDNSAAVVAQPVVAAGGIVSNLQMVHIISPAVGPNHNFTVRGAGAGNGYIAVTVKAFRLRTGTPVYNNDQVDDILAAVASIQPGSLTPPADNCLVITMTGNNIDDSVAATPNAPFDTTDITQASVGGTSYGIGMAHEAQGTATARNPLWTGGGNADRCALICSFGSV